MSFDYFGDGWRPTFSTRTINGTWVSGLVFAGPLVGRDPPFLRGGGGRRRRRKIRVDRCERVKEGGREREERFWHGAMHATKACSLERGATVCVPERFQRQALPP